MHGAHSSRFPVAPVVLIALGVVFLLDNLDLLELRRMLRYWPVLLIALGVYMLYIRMAGSPDRASGENRGTGEKPMSGNFWCAIRGPILLITLGVLLAIDQFGVVQLRPHLAGAADRIRNCSSWPSGAARTMHDKPPGRGINKG